MTVETPMTKSLQDRLAIFEAVMGELSPRLPAGGRVVDLGCGHCLFLEAAASMGYEVTGMDVRMQRVPEEWVPYVLEQNAVSADLEPYDLILCLGLFYHLELEDQIRLAAKFAGRPAVVDTHYGKLEVTRKAFGKSYGGSIYREGNLLTSGAGHRESFWPTEQDLVAILGREHNVLKWMPEHVPGRSFYILMPRA